MASDNVTLNAGSGGSTLRTLADSSNNEWPASVVCYATTVSPGANVLQVVTSAAGLPVAQATAANLNATVVGTGVFAVQAAQSGTWNIGTVTTVTTVAAVTAITDALPAGTNLLGQVAAAPMIGAVFNGTTAIIPQYAAITANGSGPTTVVAAVSGKKIYILRWSLSANGNVNVNWQSHATTSIATGLHYMTQYATAGGAYCPAGIFATAAGEALDINLSAAVAVGGELTYVQF